MVQSVCLSVSTLFLFCRPLYIALYCTLFPQFGFYSCCSTSLVLMKTSRWNFPEEWWNFLKVHLVNFILWKLEALLVFFPLIWNMRWCSILCRLSGNPLSPCLCALLSQITATDHLYSPIYFSLSAIRSAFSLVAFFSNNPDYFLLSSSLSRSVAFPSGFLPPLTTVPKVNRDNLQCPKYNWIS